MSLFSESFCGTLQLCPLHKLHFAKVLVAGPSFLCHSFLKRPLSGWGGQIILSMAKQWTHSAGFEEEGPDSAAAMEHAYKWILKYGGGLAFILIIAWPCLALPAGVFSKGYFTFWVIISIIWGLVSPPALCVLSDCPNLQSCMVLPEGVSSAGYLPFWVTISIIRGLVSLFVSRSVSARSAILPSCSHAWRRQSMISAMTICPSGKSSASGLGHLVSSDPLCTSR